MTLPRRIKQPKTRQSDRIRCPGHLAFVRSRACSVPGCPSLHIEAAHVRTGTDGSAGTKPGDNWAISLCGSGMRVNGHWTLDGHHAEQHRIGEQAFEKKYGIDMKKLAAEFAAKSDPLRRYLARKRAA